MIVLLILVKKAFSYLLYYTRFISTSALLQALHLTRKYLVIQQKISQLLDQIGLSNYSWKIHSNKSSSTKTGVRTLPKSPNFKPLQSKCIMLILNRVHYIVFVLLILRYITKVHLVEAGFQFLLRKRPARGLYGADE